MANNNLFQQAIAYLQNKGDGMQKNTKASLDAYFQQVEANKKEPFFNNQGNNPAQWAGKVVEDVKQRGPFEGAQDLTYPVLMNPYVEPITEPITGDVRVANYKAGRPFPVVNAALGQSDYQMGQQPRNHLLEQILAKLYGNKQQPVQ